MHDVRCRNYDQIGTRPKRTHSRTLLLRTFARVPLIGMASDCLRKGLYLVAVSVEFEKENLLDHGRQILVQGRWKRNQGRRDPRILLPGGPLIFGDVKTLEIFAFRGWDSTKKKQEPYCENGRYDCGPAPARGRRRGIEDSCASHKKPEPNTNFTKVVWMPGESP